MCLGVPVRVENILPSGAAHCSTYGADQNLRTVEVSLLDSPPAIGDWLLAHVDVAIRALDPEEAQQIGDALHAVAAAAAGEDFEHLLADLIDREPQLPPHLQKQAAGETGNG